MSEAAFPLLGTAFVVLAVLPAFALFAKAGLAILERKELGGPLHALHLRYALLTGSSALPIAWLLSAGLHQAETGKSVLVCLFDHGTGALCFEPGFFALMLASATLALSLGVIRKRQVIGVSSTEESREVLARAVRLVARNPALAQLDGRLAVTEDDGFTLGTHGLLKPRVFIGAAFATRLSDDMLESALGHEARHVRSLDPLRYLLLHLALAVNPLGRFLLEPHAARWMAAREAHCDREAVIHGAAPLPLADAIIRAARPNVRGAVALGAGDTAVLQLRVGLLLAFAERAPAHCCRANTSGFPMTLALLLITLLLPHETGIAALDLLHTGTEHAVTYFLR